MPAYGYEFYFFVFNSISHSFAALTREILSWPFEDKIHIHARACNILYILLSMGKKGLVFSTDQKISQLAKLIYRNLKFYYGTQNGKYLSIALKSTRILTWAVFRSSSTSILGLINLYFRMTLLIIYLPL